MSELAFRVSELAFRVSGLAFRVSGLPCRVSGLARGFLFMFGCFFVSSSTSLWFDLDFHSQLHFYSNGLSSLLYPYFHVGD